LELPLESYAGSGELGGYTLCPMTAVDVELPIFPLAGTVLFPHTRQLLHIFEPRYREMTQDAIEGDGSIGLVLPKAGSEQAEEPVPVYSIGCRGQITASRRLPDGRFLILLQGTTRFEILREEPSDKLYRRVAAKLLPEPLFDDLDPAIQQELVDARRELEVKMLEVTPSLDPQSRSTLQERMDALNPIELIHALAFGLECSSLEKQALLEVADPLERCRDLTRLLDFYRVESQLPESPRTFN